MQLNEFAGAPNPKKVRVYKNLRRWCASFKQRPSATA
jgi:hypothetical protein